MPDPLKPFKSSPRTILIWHRRLMLERTNERKEHRTVPLNTTGQSLLSGNVFCGHCGGRLVLTTNGTTVPPCGWDAGP